MEARNYVTVTLCVPVRVVVQLLEELCLLNGWPQPQYHVLSTLHNGLPVFACRVSTHLHILYSVLMSRVLIVIVRELTSPSLPP